MPIQILTEPASGVKCPRCFRHTHSMNHNGLCNRCVAILCINYADSDLTKAVIDQLESRGLKQTNNPELENV
jgi:hypothetical protein